MTFAIEILPAALRELEGHDLMRVRVGDCRIVYTVIDQRLVVLIVRVAHRSRVYRGL